MIFAFLSAALALPVSAKPIVIMEHLLARPVDARAREFKALGPKGYEFLSRTAADPAATLQSRWRAITTMGRLDPVIFHKDLEAALVSSHWYVRNAALIAIRNSSRGMALTWSTRLLEDPALVVRTQAVRNLIDLDAREAEPILWKQIWDKRNFRGRESLWIRTHLAEAVAKFVNTGRAKLFERLLLDQDERVHKWAIIGLEKTTGMKMSDKKEPVDVRRRKWLAVLGVESA